MMLNIKETLKDYNGREHIRGQHDCNLLFFKIHEPLMFEKMHGAYHDILSGVKAANRLFKFKSLRNFLKHSEYTLIPNNFQRHGDVITFKKGHENYICLGTKWFGVREDNTFGLVNRYHFDPSNYLVYRKEIYNG